MSKPYASLLPGIEHRLAAWEQIQYRLARTSEPRLRPALTLSRQFGCEGFPLAERLKELLEAASSEPWNVYDRTLVERVARDENISPRLLENLGDMTSRLEHLGLHASTHVSHDEVFAKVAKAIVQIAALGNAILVGRGGAVLCGDLKTCFHFRLEAGFEWRVARIMARLDMGREDAEEMVRTHSKLREKFINRCLGVDLAEVRHYHAVFNNERCSVEEIAAAILAYVKRGWRENAYFGGEHRESTGTTKSTS